MRDAVRQAFFSFNAPFEGAVATFYADVLGLVTIGVGNLVDPIEVAERLPMKRKDGSLATPIEIRSDWAKVKHDPNAARFGWKYSDQFADLHLEESDIRALVAQKMLEMESLLLRRLPSWDRFPADAQLATLSLSWANGPAMAYPRLFTALRSLDFSSAVHECSIDEKGNLGVVPRNIANRRLYANAAQVIAQSLDPDVLYYPRGLSEERPTDPDLSATIDGGTVTPLVFVDPDDEPPQAA